MGDGVLRDPRLLSAEDAFESLDLEWGLAERADPSLDTVDDASKNAESASGLPARSWEWTAT